MGFAALLPALIGAGGSLLGGLFGSKQNQQATSTPNLSPMQSNLMNQVLGAAGNQLSSVPANLSGYFSNAMQGNLQNERAQQAALQRTLVSRGLQNSPFAASAMAGMQQQGANANQQLINQMPLLRMQLLQQALQQATSTFASTPYGTTQKGNLQAALPVGSAIGQSLGAFGGLMNSTGGWGKIFGNNSIGATPSNTLGPLQTSIPWSSDPFGIGNYGSDTNSLIGGF